MDDRRPHGVGKGIMTELRGRAFVVLALLTLYFGSACASATPERQRRAEPVRDSRLITRAEIAESGARDAWEAIRHTTGLSLSESGTGQPLGARMRGRTPPAW